MSWYLELLQHLLLISSMVVFTNFSRSFANINYSAMKEENIVSGKTNEVFLVVVAILPKSNK